MKKNKKIKGILLSAISILLVIAIVYAGSTLKNSNDAKKWNEHIDLINNTPDSDILDYFANDSDFVYNMEDFEKDIEKVRNSNEDLNSEANEWKATERAVPEVSQKLFDEANQALIKFFEEKYSVSVEDKLSVYEVKQVDIPSEYGITGYYSYDEKGNGNITYLNSSELFDSSDIYNEYSKSQLLSIYIHETIHYLGIYNPNVRETELIIEGITTALTFDVLKYMNLDTDGNNGYSYELNMRLARQLMETNKDLIKMMLSADKKGDKVLFDELAGVLGEKGAKDLCEMNTLLCAGFVGSRFTGNMESLNVAQYLTAEYCKSFNLTDKEILEIHKYFISPVSKI